MMLITDDWNDCAENDIDMRVMTDKAKISDRITNMIFILHTVTNTAYALGTVIADVDITDKIELPLINKLELPFSVNTQRTYRLVLIIEFIHMIFTNWVSGVINIIFLAMVIHTGGQMDVLQRFLAEFTPNEIENKKKSVVITAIGSADFVEQMTKCVLFFIITNMEAFIFCYGGEYLNSKSKEIGFATYNCAWYNLKSKHSRILLLVILRSQEQLTLTAGKIMDLTLQSFTSLDRIIVHRKFMETMMLITDDWNDCAENDIGLRVMTDKAKISDRIANMIFILRTATITAYCLRNVITDVDITDKIELPLSTKIELPFSISTQRMYRLVLITEFIHAIFASWVQCVINIIFLAMILHVGGQMDILQHWLAEFISKKHEIKQKSVVITTSKIILKHQKIIQFSENIESIFTYIALFIFASNTLLMCCLGFLIITAISTADIGVQMTKCFLFFTLVNLEAFIFCYAGEYLNSKSKDIGFATYNCAWYNLKSKHSRILLLVILRSQEQLKLTAGKIMDLKLETFTSHDRIIVRRKFVETMMLITDDWNDCAENDIDMRVMTDKAKISDRITNMSFILHTATIAAYSFGTLIADIDITDKIELPHINKLELPFSVNTQRMYRLVLITELIFMIFANCVSGVINIIFFAMIIHVGGQMDVLQRLLAEFIPKGIENKQKSVVISPNKIILKHQKIIQFSECIESLYTYIALLIFASNTILMCSLGFLIVTAIGTADIVEQLSKCVLFFTLTNLEAFIFCYGGEYLNSKSNEIGFATYNCAWYNLKSKHSRILLLVILRSQKCLTLTAGKIMDLTLESFTSIMNASGSYLSVLLAMQ
ncbi:PREDICTED: uncharacterized protein LOC108778730 [Cyphomyrmex costatus]|uniref:uncharacterized protein LOC108778730 n=1 Tax=Cyphomyrmex costatus TaxID=456900 RepID=UPI000852468D|nr:PREDICTED: uncharacterized protein LOC108778730 [Cyphomyrmex costatus]